jgi:hypothetical protein
MNETKTNQEEKTPPFTEDQTFTRKIGNTTYILTAKYKKNATEGLADKLMRIIENSEDRIF